jgi:hypothetical protein
MCRMRFSWKNSRDDDGELPSYRPIYEEVVLLKYTSASRNIVMSITRSNNKILKVNCQPAIYSDTLLDGSTECEKAGEAFNTSTTKI